MIFQVYENPDGTEELRLRPENEQDCDDIDDCSECFFEDSNESFFGKTTDDDDDFISKFGAELLGLSSKMRRTPRRPHSSQELFDEVSRSLNLPKSIEEEDDYPELHIIARSFSIENGKVNADPETLRLMNRLGIVEKIERTFREEEKGN